MPPTAAIETRPPRRSGAESARALFAQKAPDHCAALEIRRFRTGRDVIGYECGTFAERLRGRRLDGGRNDQHFGRVPVNRRRFGAARIGLTRNAADPAAVSCPTAPEGPGSDGR